MCSGIPQLCCVWRICNQWLDLCDIKVWPNFVCRYLIASHTTDYQHPMLFLNTLAVFVMVVAKFPHMHKVRIFGINGDQWKNLRKQRKRSVYNANQSIWNVESNNKCHHHHSTCLYYTDIESLNRRKCVIWSHPIIAYSNLSTLCLGLLINSYLISFVVLLVSYLYNPKTGYNRKLFSEQSRVWMNSWGRFIYIYRFWYIYIYHLYN
jgi:hypothetical protein